MEVEELLMRAWSAVEKAGIPEALQEYAFKEALAWLSGANSTSTFAAGDGAPTVNAVGASVTNAVPAGDTDAMNGSDDGLFAKFSRESSIPVEDLERVFYFSNGEPRLNGPRTRFGKTTADQAKVVAVALTAAYDYALDRMPISDDIVRAEAIRLKCDLGGNWARTMATAAGVSWVGAARQKQFKVKLDTADVLKRVVATILGSPTE